MKNVHPCLQKCGQWGLLLHNSPLTLSYIVKFVLPFFKKKKKIIVGMENNDFFFSDYINYMCQKLDAVWMKTSEITGIIRGC